MWKDIPATIASIKDEIGVSGIGFTNAVWIETRDGKKCIAKLNLGSFWWHPVEALHGKSQPIYHDRVKSWHPVVVPGIAA